MFAKKDPFYAGAADAFVDVRAGVDPVFVVSDIFFVVCGLVLKRIELVVLFGGNTGVVHHAKFKLEDASALFKLLPDLCQIH